MAWSVGHSLILLLALVVGLAAGWLLRGRLSGGATGPRSVARPDTPHQAGSRAPVPVRETPVSEPADGRGGEAAKAGVGTVVEEPADDNASAVEEPADNTVGAGEDPVGASTGEPHDSSGEEPVDDAAGKPRTASSSAAVESDVDTVSGPVLSDTAEPVQPTEPAEPVQPAEPAEPVQPAEPAEETVDQAPPAEETADQVAPAEVAPQPDDPKQLVTTPAQPAPVVGADDNLRRIDGIGPKIALALNAAGIQTYRQLAEATEPELRAAVRAANLRSAPGLSNWAQQARVLAEGGSAVAAG